MIEVVLPTGFASAELLDDAEPGALAPGEERALGAAGPTRRRDFMAGRDCARRALMALGAKPDPVLAGPQGEPRWPDGIVGSITHCPAYSAAAVAAASAFAGVGIDAEVHEALPDGLMAMVARPEEQAWIAALGAGEIWWDRVLFSAKESIYKACHPLVRRWLGFEDAVVTVDPQAGTFRATLLPFAGDPNFAELTGRFRVTPGLILTAVALPVPRPRHP